MSLGAYLIDICTQQNQTNTMNLGTIAGNATLKIQTPVNGVILNADAIGAKNVTVKMLGKGLNKKLIDNLPLGVICEALHEIDSVYTPNTVYLPFTTGGSLELPVDAWLEVTFDAEQAYNIECFGIESPETTTTHLTFTEEFIGTKGNTTEVDLRNAYLMSFKNTDFPVTTEIDFGYQNGSEFTRTVRELQMQELVKNGIASVIANGTNNPTALNSIKLGNYATTSVLVADVDSVVIDSSDKKSLYLFGQASL